MPKINKKISELNITHNQIIVPSDESVRKSIKIEKSTKVRSKTMNE